ncbi:MAG: aminotransferase class I/II-fold pyridoxal phosphate-dependent enzyme [Spirochaetaceae bacterium]|jgi:aspartate/methionine/tyrosine aminotransferase|nr:aminotransferase class I/II-fold pyridoxal phosphate-dependent enzyme [Spirochaetaceae bacterium]
MEHELARELNETLRDTAPGALLSAMGRRLYFPKGIIAQSAEANQHSALANGTLGIAAKHKSPLILSALGEQVPGMSAAEMVSYAPTAGINALRETWAAEIRRKNPSLEKAAFSLPVVTPGLTAGMSALADLFLDEGQTLAAANPSWDNYALIAEARRNARLRPVDMFTDRGIDMAALKAALSDEARKTGAVRLLLNFPHNPTGYSPTREEARDIRGILRELAETGAKILVICDDAYFGLRFEENIEAESLFAGLAVLHENVFAAKVDGSTKEDFAWGLRCGFLTFGGKNLSAAHYEALIKKVMAVIRSTVSCSSTVVQNLLQKMYAHGGDTLNKERAAYRDIIEGRYKKVRAFVDPRKNHPWLQPMPFNSGYFMSFKCNGIDAESLRQKLLFTYGVGTIAINPQTLRVAFSGLDDEGIDEVYTRIYRAAEELAGNPDREQKKS